MNPKNIKPISFIRHPRVFSDIMHGFQCYLIFSKYTIRIILHSNSTAVSVKKDDIDYFRYEEPA